MKIVKITTIVYFFLSIINSSKAQNIEYYKNTCHVFNIADQPRETGFIALNDSVVLSNYKDSVLAIDLKNCRIIRKLDFSILSEMNDDVNYSLRSPIVRIFREAEKLWVRLKFKDNQTWFGYFKQDLTFIKICRINTANCLFSKIGKNFYAITNGGDFFNNGSTVPTSIQSGIISFTENGYLLNAKSIQQAGGLSNFVPRITMINDDRNIYLGSYVDNGKDWPQKTYKIYFGDKLIDCVQGGGGIPYVMFKTDTAFNYIESFSFGGVTNTINQDKDSLYLFGTGGNVYKKNYGKIISNLGDDYHYKIAIAKSDFKTWSYCTISASGGTGGYWDVLWREGYNYHHKSGFTYLTFKGTVYFDKPYTSGGGQNFVLGYDNNKCSDLKNITMVNSQSDIWANFAETDSFHYISISRRSDFWIGDTRINNGEGIYYFVYGKNGIVDLFKLSNTTSKVLSNNPSKISIGPNPSSGIIRFNNVKESTVIRVLSHSGRDLGNFTIDNGILDLSKVKSGIYILIMSDNKYYRVVINKNEY